VTVIPDPFDSGWLKINKEKRQSQLDRTKKSITVAALYFSLPD
jgi:hypothetical protein